MIFQPYTFRNFLQPIETILWFLNFHLFLGLKYVIRSFLIMLVAQRAAVPTQHVIPRVNYQYTHNHSVFIQSFCFSLSVTVFNKLLYHKIGFVLDNFAQVSTNVSVLSMFKMGWAKL